MSLEENKIVSIRELLNKDQELDIPPYQRPYRWITKSALTLFNDIYLAYKNHIQEYRIGTVILHKEEKNENGNKIEVYNIVDGQQRITTILILLYCIKKVLNSLEEKKDFNELTTDLDYDKLFKIKYTEISYKSIVDNYKVLHSKCNEIKNELDSYLDYLLDKCTFVKIVTNELKEAFQLFDSQNSRGKDLSPHDLLKAYHLREMNNEEVRFKIKLINKWENINQKELEKFFYYHLYPLIKWYKNKSGLYYSKNDIGNFKGIKQNSIYNYSIYHKAANLYVEKYNNEGMYELMNGKHISQFQLTQPLISGRRFFEYTCYYYNLIDKCKELIRRYYTEDELLLKGGTGDIYTNSLFLNVILFYVDKFGLGELTERRVFFFYKWCYSLRLVMYAVYQETINKYALGTGRINQGINLFEKIAEINNPSELDSISFKEIKSEELNENYRLIWKKIFGE